MGQGGAAGQELVARTTAGVRELRALISVLTDDDLQAAVTNGWTVSAQLAHLAFWDRWVDTRWSMFDHAGAFDDLPDSIGNLVNDSAESLWLAVSGASARELVIASAERVTRRIEALKPQAIEAALRTDRPAMLDRTRHWQPHSAEIRKALSRSA